MTKPTAIQPSPAYRVLGYWITTSSNDSALPTPPITENRGQSTQRQRKFGRARHGMSCPALRRRNWITEACAIVNESIAPNEYIVPRKFVLPGRRTRIEMKPAKTTSEIHGVLNFGCSRRKRDGSCR